MIKSLASIIIVTTAIMPISAHAKVILTDPGNAMMVNHHVDVGMSVLGSLNPLRYRDGSDLKEAGTDPFATIQEVIKQLEGNVNTDWNKVSIEDLRIHLVHMEDMTLNVDVSESNIENGFKALIMPTSKRAIKSLKEVLGAHPKQMKKETGWDMAVKETDLGFEIGVTTSDINEVDKIRALGYIGVMAYGKHHQPHHWGMASGEDPHNDHSHKH